MVDNDQTWKRFNAFELVWAGGILGRATAQAYYWAMRLQEAAAERRAQIAKTAGRRAQAAGPAAEPEQAAAAAPSAVYSDDGESSEAAPGEDATSLEAGAPSTS